jgi:HD-GYP domain-containing protein (c-di-GMP phosphodiesterase class II)
LKRRTSTGHRDRLRGRRRLKGAALTIRYHHEHFDGTGYSEGLRGDVIPLSARVFTVVDIFDALTTERPYKQPKPLAESLWIIEHDSNGHFDPSVVAAFKSIAPRLYGEAVQASGAELKRRLREALQRYFKFSDARPKTHFLQGAESP